MPKQIIPCWAFSGGGTGATTRRVPAMTMPNQAVFRPSVCLFVCLSLAVPRAPAEAGPSGFMADSPPPAHRPSTGGEVGEGAGRHPGIIRVWHEPQKPFAHTNPLSTEALCPQRPFAHRSPSAKRCAVEVFENNVFFQGLCRGRPGTVVFC